MGVDQSKSALTIIKDGIDDELFETSLRELSGHLGNTPKPFLLVLLYMCDFCYTLFIFVSYSACFTKLYFFLSV